MQSFIEDGRTVELKYYYLNPGMQARRDYMIFFQHDEDGNERIQVALADNTRTRLVKAAVEKDKITQMEVVNELLTHRYFSDAGATFDEGDLLFFK